MHVGRAVTLTALFLALTAFHGAVFAKPFVPANDSEVLERLPERLDPSLKQLKRLRATLARTPSDLGLASLVAQMSIEAARTYGDPRFLGQAQAALGPWWTAKDPPRDALLMRATIRQSNHDFRGALADLDALVARAPADGQALLTRATVRTVVGEYPGAQSDCAALARLTLHLVAVACTAAPASLSGHAATAYDSLRGALANGSATDPGLREWALTLAGEIAERRGDDALAEAHFRDAYALDPQDAYLAAAYADLLIARGRPDEALTLLAERTANDNLLLRIVLAERAIPARAAAFATHRRELADRYEAARRRGDALHMREEAQFRLSVENDVAAALRLARANWTVQKEPADLRILAASATAARDAATLDEVRRWRASHQLEDARLAALIGVER